MMTAAHKVSAAKEVHIKQKLISIAKSVNNKRCMRIRIPFLERDLFYLALLLFYF